MTITLLVQTGVGPSYFGFVDFSVIPAESCTRLVQNSQWRPGISPIITNNEEQTVVLRLKPDINLVFIHSTIIVNFHRYFKHYGFVTLF